MEFMASSQPGVQRARARIIVEFHDGQWVAWFADSPQLSAGAEYPSDAMWRLFELFGDADFETDSISPVDDAATVDHPNS
jgi:hypothetical protein